MRTRFILRSGCGMNCPVLQATLSNEFHWMPRCGCRFEPHLGDESDSEHGNSRDRKLLFGFAPLQGYERIQPF